MDYKCRVTFLHLCFQIIKPIANTFFIYFSIGNLHKCMICLVFIKLFQCKSIIFIPFDFLIILLCPISGRNCNCYKPCLMPTAKFKFSVFICFYNISAISNTDICNRRIVTYSQHNTFNRNNRHAKINACSYSAQNRHTGNNYQYY